MTTYYPGLDYSTRVLTSADQVAMRNHEQSIRLSNEVESVMSNPSLTPEEKRTGLTRLHRIYTPIPVDATLFWSGYKWVTVDSIDRWEWSNTFGRWGAIVTIDGSEVYTYPYIDPVLPTMARLLTVSRSGTIASEPQPYHDLLGFKLQCEMILVKLGFWYDNNLELWVNADGDWRDLQIDGVEYP